METSNLLLALVMVIAVSYAFGRGRSISVVAPLGGIKTLNSLPFYHGMLTALWCAIPSLFLTLLWLLFEPKIIETLVISQIIIDGEQVSSDKLSLMLNTVENILAGTLLGIEPSQALIDAAEHLRSLRQTSQMAMTVSTLSLAMMGGLWAMTKISPNYGARVKVEKTFKIVLLACSCIAILTTIGIVLSVLFESLRFFKSIPATDFLFGLQWSPQTAIRADQVGGSGAFGAVPLFAGTMLISFIAMLVAVPVGLMAAIYLSEYASTRFRTYIKPLIEILAGIPTVVYGFFAALTVAPAIREAGSIVGLSPSSESALAAGLVMGVMIIPFVSSLSDDVINAVPQSLRDGSLGLGATRSETIKQVVIPAALPGIVSGVLLAASRAIGETMIVVMAAGLAAKLTANPLESVTTVTVQIVTLLVGDQEFDSPKTLAAFALGLMLFTVTLGLNFIAQHVVKKYREQYD